MGMVLMSKRELNRIDILARLERPVVTHRRAADLLRVSERQVYRLQQPLSRVDGQPGSPIAARPPLQQPAAGSPAEHAVSLVRQHYADFGPTLAAEKLEERHALRVSRETLRTWMIQAGSGCRGRAQALSPAAHRREHLGELIQIDGCEHRWFEDRGPPCTLLVFVDDATSRLMALGFVPSESAFAYFEVLRRYLETHGKPVAFYSDKHSIFRVNKEEAASGDGMTQFGRALASSTSTSSAPTPVRPRAGSSGRMRPCRTGWSRRLRAGRHQRSGGGNAFLPGFIESYNSNVRPAAGAGSGSAPAAGADERSGRYLCWRETRRVSRQLVVHYNRMKFMLHPTEITARLVGQTVEIFDFPDGRLEIRWKGLSLAYAAFDKLQRVNHAAIVENKRLGEVLAWIKERAGRPAHSVRPWGRTPPLKQKAGLMKDRADRLAQVAQSQPKP